MKFADLHLHTCHSDGTGTPSEVVAKCKELGLSALAITDHDTTDGIPESVQSGIDLGIEVLAGTEITTVHEGLELHLLAYFINETWNDDCFQTILLDARTERHRRVTEFVARINARGVPLALEAVESIAQGASPGRPHIARALTEGGFTTSYEDAFYRFLRPGTKTFVERQKISAVDAIQLIRKIGGVSVVAHPGLSCTDAHIKSLAEHGLGGIEVWHPAHSEAQMQYFETFARELKILMTGGSDAHSLASPKSTIGKIKLPYIYIEELRNAFKNKH